MFGLALKGILSRKIRSWMTVLGIVIGVSAIVSLFLLGNGLTKSVEEQFSAIGADKIFVLPGSGLTGIIFHELNEEDLSALKLVDGIAKATGLYSKQSVIEWHDRKKQVYVVGVDKEFNSVKFSYGVDLFKGSYLEGDRDALIGYELWSGNLFGDEVKLGDKIMIGGKSFKVVGLIDRIGNKQDDSHVVISLKALWDIVGKKGRYSFFVAQVTKKDELNLAVERIKRTLRKKHGVKEGEEDFTVQTAEDLMSSFLKVFNIIKYFVLGIAGISILVGCIGIMNVMYSSVLERRREIGIMRALGCTKKHILFLFLVESAFLGFFGGVLGACLGIGFAKLFEAVARTRFFGMLEVSIDPLLVLLSIGGAVLVSSFAGLLPALKATKIEVAEAVRWE